jgi:hypothetical protein
MSILTAALLGRLRRLTLEHREERHFARLWSDRVIRRYLGRQFDFFLVQLCVSPAQRFRRARGPLHLEAAEDAVLRAVGELEALDIRVHLMVCDRWGDLMGVPRQVTDEYIDLIRRAFGEASTWSEVCSAESLCAFDPAAVLAQIDHRSLDHATKLFLRYYHRLGTPKTWDEVAQEVRGHAFLRAVEWLIIRDRLGEFAVLSTENPEELIFNWALIPKGSLPVFFALPYDPHWAPEDCARQREAEKEASL